VGQIQSGLSMKTVDPSFCWIAFEVEEMLMGTQNPEREGRGAQWLISEKIAASVGGEVDDLARNNTFWRR